ncbi:MAG: VanW family protein [Eubacterium sp.]|nr:VanW family protein [Eubacterium sp.]
MSKRLEKKQKRKQEQKKKRIIFLVVFLLLVTAYLIACAVPQDGKNVSRVYINGVDVSGLGEKETAQKVQKDFTDRYSKLTITVRALEKDYPVHMFDSLSVDVDKAVKEAASFAHGSFLTRGAALIKAGIFKQEYTWNPQVTDNEALKKAIEDAGLMEINTTVQTRYKLKEKELVFKKGVTGVSVDGDKLMAVITENVQKQDFQTVIESPMLTGTVKPVDMNSVYKKVYKKKKDATLDPKKDYKIVKSVHGVSFDVDKAKEALDSAAEGERISVPLIIDKPKITTDQMKKYLFRDTLGKCITNVGGTNARVSNVALAAKKINGTILLPGESFSYNDTVGERTAARGFQKAPAYLEGKTVQELGGGICQVSSTLYKAVLLSNLKIEEHHNHSYVSSYIGIGMDATVSWNGPDFQFSNNRDYPIKIIAEYSGGQVTCRIEGSNLDGSSVEMTAETLQVKGCNTVYQEDSELEKGKTEVVSSGHDGYVVQTYRKVYDKNGKLISSNKEAYCVYRTQDRVIRVGTKEPEPVSEPETEESGATEE